MAGQLPAAMHFTTYVGDAQSARQITPALLHTRSATSDKRGILNACALVIWPIKHAAAARASNPAVTKPMDTDSAGRVSGKL
jgi:hypothetical protein